MLIKHIGYDVQLTLNQKVPLLGTPLGRIIFVNLSTGIPLGSFFIQEIAKYSS